MPEIKPFRGWRYNKAVVRNLARVVAPPYDVISKEEQERFHKKSPYNIIRLILGKDKKGDSSRNNKYARARLFLKEWISKGVISREEAPAVYVYAQDYRQAGRSRTRLGFIAAMKIDERFILRHENTLASPKRDRMALLKEVRTNLSPIFGLFEDKTGRIQKILKETLKLKPCVNVSMDGVRHRVFVEDRPSQLGRISGLVQTKPMFIADGHHRFEVACQFRRWMRSRFRKEPGASWDYVMTYLSDYAHNPFEIFPTHRLLRIPKNMKEPLEVLRKGGRLVRVKSLSSVLGKLARNRMETKDRAYRFGVYLRNEGFFIFTLAKVRSSRTGKSPVDQLDVAVLHKTLIEPCFGIKKIEKSPDIDFTRDAGEAVRKVNAGEFDVAVFLRPTSLDEMLLVSRKGLKMPQKSTYFYPKLLSGLVFHKFDENGTRPL